MSLEKNDPQLEQFENTTERVIEPKTMLDSIRKWAHTRVLVAGFVAGTAFAATACEEPAGKDGTEQANQNEMYQGCEPFSMCLTTGLYDEDTNERIGFSLWYKVPEGEQFDNVTMRVIAEDGRELAVTQGDCLPGTDQVHVTIPGFQGDIEHEEAPNAIGIEIEVPGNEPILIINKEIDPLNDDDGPSLGN